MRRERPADTATVYRRVAHKVGKYTYAATYTVEGENVRKQVCRHWGRLNDEKEFEPKTIFVLLPSEERKKFGFPQDWKLAALERLRSHRRPGRPTYAEAHRDRLYGHIWLLEQLSEQLDMLQDLERVFGGNLELVDIILSLAMYAIVLNKAFSHMADAQEDKRFPTSFSLTPTVITRVSQSITEQNRLDLFELRQLHAPKSNVCAVDSTSRCGWALRLPT